MNEHLVFFDSECPLCRKAVQHLVEIDQDHHIRFAPLNGTTSANILTGPLKPYTETNSLVLIENYQSTERKFWIRSKAVLRIYWLIGRGWGLLGWLSFLPAWLGDCFYRSLANHRHQFKLKVIPIQNPDRFLP
jgi:predicted DCC family thiol-disulfide oxidoreductase YuxK